MLIRLLVLSLALLAVSGCGSVGLHDHVFLGRDAWTRAFWEARFGEARTAGPAEPLAISRTLVHRAVEDAVRSICPSSDAPAAPAESPRNIHLARGQFHDFVKALVDDIRDQRFALAGAALKDAPGQISLPHLLAAYLSASFSGKFVDRNGGLYSKPKVGTVVSNDTITGLAAVALEALMDHEVMRSSCVYYPVYFVRGDKDLTFLTKDGRIPTLAKVIYHLNQGNATDDKPDYYERARMVVGVKGPTPPATVTQALAVVRYFGGLTGDGAQAVTGLLMRDFGGVSVGVPVALGKLSIGDNETLSKLIDTIVETLGRRLTEAAVSTALGPSAPPNVLTWIFVGASPDRLAKD
jgi:hypothetical protein